MSLRWRAFERDARHQVRAAVRTSGKLSEQYRQNRRSRWRNLNLPDWVTHPFLVGCVAAFLLDKSKPTQPIIAFLALWTLAAVFLRASQLGASLYDPADLSVLINLPVPDTAVFRRRWLSFVTRSLLSILDFTALFSVLGFQLGMGWASFLPGLAFGLVQWLFVVAGAVCLYALLPRRSLYLPALLFGAGAFGVFVFGSALPALAPAVSQGAWWLPPLGWELHALGLTLNGSAVQTAWSCVSSALLLTLLPWCYRRIRQTYALDQWILAGNALAAEADDAPPAAGAKPSPPETPRTQEQAADAVYSGAFRAGLDWKKSGLLERFISRLLRPHDRCVLEFLVAARPNWTSGWRRASMMILGMTLIGLLFSRLRSGALGFLSFMAVLFTVAHLFGRWRAFSANQSAGGESPCYTLYPIGFGQIARLVLLVNSIRLACCLPVLASAAAVLTVQSHWDSPAASVIGLKVMVLSLLAQPLLPIFLISPGTNDTRKARFVFVALALGAGLFGCAVAFFLTASHSIGVIAASGFGALSLTALLLYGWMFNHNGFDLAPVRTTVR